MITQKDNLKKVYIFFIIFIILYALNLILPVSLLNVGNLTSRMWLLFELLVMILSVFIIIKEKLPSIKMIVIALLLGVLAGLSNPIVGICTILTFMASASIFNKYSGNMISIFKKFTLKQVCLSIGLGILVGSILGCANLFLSGNQTMNFEFKLQYLKISLNPGIFEEVSFRLFMYAFSLYLLKGELDSRKKVIWCYILMVLPHVLIHTPDIFLEYGVISFIINLIILSLLFGIPFALLQKKRDLSSAMIAHGLVDFIRFYFFGLPI